MPSLHQIKLSPPSDWQELQRMTCDLYKKIWETDYVREFGYIGQRQNGVDIFGFPNGGKQLEGIQCKCVEKLKKTDIVYTLITRLELSKLKSEVDKIDKDAFVVMHSIKDVKGGMIKKKPMA